MSRQALFTTVVLYLPLDCGCDCDCGVVLPCNIVTRCLQSHNNVSHVGTTVLAECLKANTFLSYLDLVSGVAGVVVVGIVELQLQ